MQVLVLDVLGLSDNAARGHVGAGGAQLTGVTGHYCVGSMNDSAQATDRSAVEGWFRHRGLPYVVRRKLGAGGLLPRSTPAFVVLLVLDPLLSEYGAVTAANHRDFVRRAGNPAYVAVEFVVVTAAWSCPLLLGWMVRLWVRLIGEGGR